MGRFAVAARILVAVSALGIVAPAFAQLGSIFSDAPPRPPADVPGGAERNDLPPSPYPPRDYPRPVRPAPQPLDVEAPPPNQPASPGVRGGGAIQSEPLPPPPGGNPAPPTRADQPRQIPGAKPITATATAPTATPPAQPPLTPKAPDETDTANPPAPGTEAALPPQETVVEPPPQRIANPIAVFAGLDKITGRITSFEVKINETVQFGALQVMPRVCYSRPPTETPRTDAFITVNEVTLKGEVRRIFTGWMFAASPGLHAVEHPIYDVWLTACKGGTLDVAGSEHDKTAAAIEQKPPAPARSARRPPARQ